MPIRKNKIFLQHKEKYENTKEAYTDRPKNIRRKVGFEVVFTNITRRRAVSEKASIHTAGMTVIKLALKEIHKR